MHELQRLENVDIPIQEEIDVGSAALRRRANALDARYAVHRFFDGPCDRDEHLRGRHDAVINDDDDARKIGLRKDGDGQLKSGVDASRTEQRDEDDDGS